MSETIRRKVEKLLKRDDQVGVLCRNNDNYLILKYIETYHKDLDIAFNMFTTEENLINWAKLLPSISEIKRVRAYFQNTREMYLATTDTRINRIEKAEEIKSQYGEELKNK